MSQGLSISASSPRSGARSAPPSSGPCPEPEARGASGAKQAGQALVLTSAGSGSEAGSHTGSGSPRVLVLGAEDAEPHRGRRQEEEGKDRTIADSRSVRSFLGEPLCPLRLCGWVDAMTTTENAGRISDPRRAPAPGSPRRP